MFNICLVILWSQGNNTRKAYQIVKDLIKHRWYKVFTIRDKNVKCLMEKEEILGRWMEYCSELYNHRIDGYPTVLHCKQPSNSNYCPILQSEVGAATKFLKKGTATEVNNIPAKLIQSGGDTLIDILTINCNKIWQSGEWAMRWMQSLIITLLNKGNLHLCQNYCTISLISHSSKVMLTILLYRPQP